MTCDCFTCANNDDLRSIKAYLLGQFEAYRDCLNALKDCGIKRGSLLEEGFPRIFAYIECNMQDSACLIDSEEFKDIKFEGSLAKEFEREE